MAQCGGGGAAVAVLVAGVARTVWGVKGVGWYWGNALLYAKLALFSAVGLLSIRPTFFQRWRRALQAGGALPHEAQSKATRRIV